MTHKSWCLLLPFLLLALSTHPADSQHPSPGFSVLSLGLTVTWSQHLPLRTSLCPQSCPASHSCCHCSSLLLGRAQNDSSWALGGRGGIKQPDRRATARTSGQPLQRALKAGTGTTENVDVCVRVRLCKRQRLQPLPPPHSSRLQNPSQVHSTFGGIFSIVRKERPCLSLPTTVLV